VSLGRPVDLCSAYIVCECEGMEEFFWGNEFLSIACWRKIIWGILQYMILVFALLAGVWKYHI
jgi:hypothetical protein